MARKAPLPARYGDAELIARGGMGDVYVARDRELGRRVAIKVLAERYAEDEAIRERFTREALAAARLSGHPHVVTIFDVGEADGRPYIVMEYLSGGTLAHRLADGAVAPSEALAWLDEAASALDSAHGAGVVHRDVKPANLLFDDRNELHVVDFGIARVLDDTTGMTTTGTILGTAGYISPEQARGEEATAASDVYALGVVAYELLAGSRPFERGSATAEAHAHVHEPVPPASERRDALPPEIDDVLERALAKDPAARYETAGDLVDQLRRALAADAERTRIIAPPAAAPTPLPPVRTRRARALAFAAVGLLLAGGGIAAAALTAAGGDGDSEPRVITRVRVLPGTTVRETVTTQVEPPPTPPPEPPAEPPPPEPPPAATTGSQLNLEGFNLMQQGRYDEALPILQQAVQKLQGTYTSTFRDEAYANYNLGKTLLELGRCSEAVPYLDRSEALQGSRPEIDAAQAEAATCLGEEGEGNGRGKGKGKNENE